MADRNNNTGRGEGRRRGGDRGMYRGNGRGDNRGGRRGGHQNDRGRRSRSPESGLLNTGATAQPPMQGFPMQGLPMQGLPMQGLGAGIAPYGVTHPQMPPDQAQNMAQNMLQLQAQTFEQARLTWQSALEFSLQATEEQRRQALEQIRGHRDYRQRSPEHSGCRDYRERSPYRSGYRERSPDRRGNRERSSNLQGRRNDQQDRGQSRRPRNQANRGGSQRGRRQSPNRGPGGRNLDRNPLPAHLNHPPDRRVEVPCPPCTANGRRPENLTHRHHECPHITSSARRFAARAYWAGVNAAAADNSQVGTAQPPSTVAQVNTAPPSSEQPSSPQLAATEPRSPDP